MFITLKSVDENVACLLGFSPNYMSQTNISAPLLPQASNNNATGSAGDREFAEVQKASARLDVAEADLRTYRTANPDDYTSAAFLVLKAEVDRCTAVLAGAQRNYSDAVNGGTGASLFNVESAFQSTFGAFSWPFWSRSSVPSPCSTQEMRTASSALKYSTSRQTYWSSWYSSTSLKNILTFRRQDSDATLFNKKNS
jgi:hypothetical protein